MPVLVLCGSGQFLAALALPSTTTGTSSEPTEPSKTKIKIAVREWGNDRGYFSIVIAYDSATDFRVYNAGVLVAYGYYDEYAQPQVTIDEL